MSMTVGEPKRRLETLDDDPEDDRAEAPEDAPRFVYVAEGGQVYDDPYLPFSVRAAIGWG